MSTITTLTQLTRQPSEFTARLLGLPVQRKVPTSLRAAENYEAVIAAHADDIARALGSTHRLPVSFHEIAVRDTATPETAAPRHRKAGPACADVTRTRRRQSTPFRAYLGAL